MHTLENIGLLLETLREMKPDIIFIEGLHFVGKSHIIEKIQFDLHPSGNPLFCYSSWNSQGGRKKFITDTTGSAGTVDGLNIQGAFFFTTELILQMKHQHVETNNPYLFPILSDRGHLSAAYYQPDEFNEDLFHEIQKGLNVAWVLVEPGLGDTYRDFWHSKKDSDGRLKELTYTEYLMQLDTYKMLFSTHLENYPNSIHYINHFK